MAEKKQDLLPYLEYEHRKKDGKVVSIGEMSIDKHGRIHSIQRDDKGKKINEVIRERDGQRFKVVEKKVFKKDAKT